MIRQQGSMGRLPKLLFQDAHLGTDVSHRRVITKKQVSGVLEVARHTGSTATSIPIRMDVAKCLISYGSSLVSEIYMYYPRLMADVATTLRIRHDLDMNSDGDFQMVSWLAGIKYAQISTVECYTREEVPLLNACNLSGRLRVTELLGYRATWIQMPFVAGLPRVDSRYSAPKLWMPLAGIRAELHWRSDWGAPGGPPERRLRRSTSVEYLRSIFYPNCNAIEILDFSVIGLPNSGLWSCPEQCPKLVKSACRYLGLSRKLQALGKVTLGSLVASIRVKSRRSVGNSIALRAHCRRVSEVGKLDFTPKAPREFRKPLRGSLRILLSELSGTQELGPRVPRDKAHFKNTPIPHEVA
ncbi:hypothetical protein PIB30_069088 [Stylosanthes scabra]|uniref:Uncharacterized protein n=1 Tax=Stylosanthes scabra TaxID=79078 RepID=A0ABU6ZLQ7_9FABA|nr:hypothetical protein [Stylosanthes scabra]